MGTRHLLLSVLFVLSALWLAKYWDYPLIYPGLETVTSNTESTIKNLSPEDKVRAVVAEIQSNAQTTIELKRAAVGYNTNLDLVCDGVELMKLLQISPSQHSYEIINTLEEFGSSFSYYFAMGSAAERYVATKQLWNEILAPLQQRNFQGCKLQPGGNAALIANRFAELGISVFLGGPVGKTLAPLIDPSVRIQQNELEPIQDEIHLILEFATGQPWEDLVSPRANRFIVSHDIQNSHLSFVEKFHQELESPQLVVLAGAHLLEGLEEPIRSERLEALAQAIASLPRTTVVHLEIAGVGNVGFFAQFAKRILPLVDSIGLNEQELGMLYVALGGSQYQSADFTAPELRTTTGAIEYLLSLPMFQTNQGVHQLNRVHLHFLSYHLIAQPLKSREGVYLWNRDRAKQAVAAGSLATTIQACGIDGKLPEVDQLRVDSKVPNAANFVQGELEFWVSPVVICKVPIRTVGLGDCISATGLATHFL